LNTGRQKGVANRSRKSKKKRRGPDVRGEKVFVVPRSEKREDPHPNFIQRKTSPSAGLSLKGAGEDTRVEKTQGVVVCGRKTLFEKLVRNTPLYRWSPIFWPGGESYVKNDGGVMMLDQAPGCRTVQRDGASASEGQRKVGGGSLRKTEKVPSGQGLGKRKNQFPKGGGKRGKKKGNEL